MQYEITEDQLAYEKLINKANDYWKQKLGTYL